MSPFYFCPVNCPVNKEGEPTKKTPLTQDELGGVFQRAIADLGLTRVMVINTNPQSLQATNFLTMEPLESFDQFPVLSGTTREGKPVKQIRNKGVLFTQLETPVKLSAKRDTFDEAHELGTVIYERNPQQE